jgi:hypothetical protein
MVGRLRHVVCFLAEGPLMAGHRAWKDIRGDADRDPERRRRVAAARKEAEAEQLEYEQSGGQVTPAEAQSVAFTDDRMTVYLRDGRELSVPLARSPRLQAASPEQRAAWQLIGAGEGIHWEALDEDISVPRLRGLPCE